MGELDMYEPFIKEIKPFAPELHFVDSHARGDKKNGYDFKIKPDVSVYHESLDGPIPEGCNISNLNMHIKFKRHRFNDPFLASSSNSAQVAFLGYSDTQQDTLGQIRAYAAAQLSSQFCAHVFSLHHLNYMALTPQYPALPRMRLHLQGLKLGLLMDTPVFKTAIPRSDDGSPLSVIFTIPDVLPSTPTCCGTCACPMYDPSGDRVVFFKDSWHLNSPDMVPEGEIYAELNRNHIPFVPTCLTSSDIQCWPKQEMQMKKYAEFPWTCQQGLLITSHTHYHLILDVVGERLTNFTSSRELVQAIHDVLILGQLGLSKGQEHIEALPGNMYCGEGKWSMLVLQQKLKEGLFPDSEEWNLLVFTEEPLAREKALMEALPIFCHKKSIERLHSHDYIIECFATHLNSSTWPENDTAMMQLLMKINHWGEEGSGNIGILKSKHILGCMLEEEEEERSCKKVRPRHGRHRNHNTRT
ncbi:hypothetical protein EDC04DRAFT_2609312 [Pisolithus marmoratus]|nr:hypothetical protein EDC04DRAFT_2609312 [Pisolithus marmoratus]